MIELVGPKLEWKPTTSGERLLFLLLKNHREWEDLTNLLREAELRIGRRYENFSSFFVGASVLYLQQRLLRLAQDVREHELDRWQQSKLLRERTCDVIQLTPLDYKGDFSALIEEVLTSAEQMHREPSKNMKKLIIRTGPRGCYSCGRLFGAIYSDAPGPDGLVATADHIWPRALGGDTTEENLLPACPSCNSIKGHVAAWQMAWIQPAVFSEVDQAKGLKGLTREAQIALHTRAAMAYSQENGTTLRDAFLAIGPREKPVRIDEDQGYDFFNLRVHDEKRTEVNWRPN